MTVTKSETTTLQSSIYYKDIEVVVPEHHSSSFRTLIEKRDYLIKPGQSIGILGQNGTGKSTLLKILSGVFPPIRGEIISNPPCVSNFSLSSGMLQHLSIIENLKYKLIQINMPRDQIDLNIEAIFEFSELNINRTQKFNTLSSGQKARVLFSLMAFSGAKNLIFDEWIGAGDAKFKRKAKNALQELINKQHIFLLASHNENLIKEYCTNIFILKDRINHFFDDVEEGLKFYSS